MTTFVALLRWLAVRLRRLFVGAVRLAGPVHNAIRGRLNPDEAVRCFAKATAVGMTTWGGIAQLMHDPEFHAKVVIPVLAGIVAGVWEAFARLGQGGAPGTSGSPSTPYGAYGQYTPYRGYPAGPEEASRPEPAPPPQGGPEPPMLFPS